MFCKSEVLRINNFDVWSMNYELKAVLLQLHWFALSHDTKSD